MKTIDQTKVHRIKAIENERLVYADTREPVVNMNGCCEICDRQGTHMVWLKGIPTELCSQCYT